MDVYNNMILNASKINQNRRVNPVSLQNLKANAATNIAASQISFSEVLQDKIAEKTELNFSKHAALRLNSRDINLTGDQLLRVEQGVNEARQKGIKDSLVLVDDVALLVNTHSRTVVTAINQGKQNIFTNIDGAVVV
ncbi:MAG: flagellar biosynthesis protein [Clostridiales bacterium]|jgi:flagellar operon protein|nr:flagellar biosynthesis protein [Clostridiales bacterium]